MKKNMGSLDRVLRIMAGVVFAVLIFAKVVSGALAIIMGLLAIMFVVTSLIGVCPGYVPFRISTQSKPRA
jgi:amino acid transporter